MKQRTEEERRKIYADQDDCLIPLSGEKPKPVPQRFLRSLPPWRAVMIARIAYNVGVMTEEELEALVQEAREVGGEGQLKGVD